MHSIDTIEEIRKDRLEISRKCDFDPKKLITFYMKRKEEKSQQRIAGDALKRT